MITVLCIVAYLAAGLALQRWGPADLRGDDEFDAASMVIFGPLIMAGCAPVIFVGWLARKVQK